LLKKWLSRARNYPLTLYLHTLSEERAQMLMEVVKPTVLSGRMSILFSPAPGIASSACPFRALRGSHSTAWCLSRIG
jgi:hypothetical protein